MRPKPRVLSEKAKKASALMMEISKHRREKEGIDWLPCIHPGTPEWSAWRSWRIEHELPTDFMDRLAAWNLPNNTGYTVCSEWPPVGSE